MNHPVYAAVADTASASAATVGATKLTVLFDIYAKIKDMLGPGFDLSEEAVVEIVSTVYERYVAPINIESIPDILEPMVDRVLKSLLIAAVRSAYGMLKG